MKSLQYLQISLISFLCQQNHLGYFIHQPSYFGGSFRFNNLIHIFYLQRCFPLRLCVRVCVCLWLLPDSYFCLRTPVAHFHPMLFTHTSGDVPSNPTHTHNNLSSDMAGVKIHSLKMSKCFLSLFYFVQKTFLKYFHGNILGWCWLSETLMMHWFYKMEQEALWKYPQSSAPWWVCLSVCFILLYV